MSITSQPNAAHDLREARQLVSETRTLLAGKTPRDPVLRHTIDWMSKDALRARLIGDGTFEDECDCQDAMLVTIDRMQADSIATGPKRYRGTHSPAGVRIAQEIARDMRKNRNGRSDLSYSQMRDRAGLRHEDTAMDRFHDLVDSGAIDYVRRSMATGAAKQWGVPQRMQISGVCFLTPHRLPANYRGIYEAERDRLRERREQARKRATARANLDRAVTERKVDSAQGGTPPTRRVRPARVFDPMKVNPAAMRRAHDTQAKVTAASVADEARDARAVAANVEMLRAEMLARCG